MKSYELCSGEYIYNTLTWLNLTQFIFNEALRVTDVRLR